MDILGWYALFATTTAVVACYELLHPVLAFRKSKFPVESYYTLYFSFFFVALLSAPIIILSCLVPSFGVRFRKALYDGLFPVPDVKA